MNFNLKPRHRQAEPPQARCGPCRPSANHGRTCRASPRRASYGKALQGLCPPSANPGAPLSARLRALQHSSGAPSPQVGGFASVALGLRVDLSQRGTGFLGAHDWLFTPIISTRVPPLSPILKKLGQQDLRSDLKFSCSCVAEVLLLLASPSPDPHFSFTLLTFPSSSSLLSLFDIFDRH